MTLTALVAFVYFQARHFQFVDLDDPLYVTANANVQAGLSWANVAWAFTTGHAPYWHPITWLSHMLDVELFGLDAGAHHLTNVLVHTANTLLLFGWLRRTTQAFWKSAFVAAMFAVHPLHVESVAWVTERKDVLAGCFWMLTLWAYVAYAVRPSPLRYLRVAGAFALALMSKPSVVTLPLVLLLIDAWPLKRVALAGEWQAWRRLGIEKLPLLAMAVATSVLTIAIQARVGAVATFGTVPLESRVLNTPVDYVLYVAKLAWPARLAAFYPLRTWSIGFASGAALALLVVTAAVLRVRHTRPYLVVGWLWYLVTLLPMIGLIQVGAQAIADRFVYVPMVGVLIIVAWGVPDLAAPCPAWVTRRLIPGAAAAAIVLGTLTSRALAASWLDDVTLWRHAIESTHNNYLASVNLGNALLGTGDMEGALQAYVGALAALRDDYPAYQSVVHLDMGSVYARQGRTVEALAEFSQATRLNPQSAEADISEGTALAMLGHPAEAVDRFTNALRINPASVEALVGMGSAFLTEGEPAAAIPYYLQAVRVEPNLAETHNALGSALAMAGRRDEAMAEFQAALRLKPDLATGYFNVAVLLAESGQFGDARRNVEQALRLDPAYAPARQLLATLPRPPV